MANINRELNDIKNAVYGKDVRKSIHDGIDKVNKESEGSRAIANNTESRQTAIEQQFDDLQQNYTEGTPSTAEVVAARTNTETNENYETIGRRMDNEFKKVTTELAETVEYTERAMSTLATRKKGKRPIVTFIVDDGKTDDLTKIKPIAIEEGVPFGLGIITNRIGTTGYMNIEEIREMKNAGCEIMLHSHDHNNFRNMSKEEMNIDLKTGLGILRKNGFNPQGFIYPYNSYDTDTVTEVRKYFDFAFAKTNGQSQGVNFPKINNQVIDRSALGSFFDVTQDRFPYPTDSLDYSKARVLEAKENKNWLVFVLHSSDTSVEQMQVIKDTISFIKSEGVDIVSPSEGFQIFGNLIDIRGNKRLVVNADGGFEDTTDLIVSISKENSRGINDSYSDFSPLKIEHVPINNAFANSEGFPEGVGGNLTTVRLSYQYYNTYQEYNTTLGSRSRYIRYVNSSGNWTEFKKINESDNLFILDEANSRLGDDPWVSFPLNKITYTVITPSHANNHNFPSKLGGKLITDRTSTSWWTAKQEYIEGTEFRTTNVTKWVRYVDSNINWTDWQLVTPLYGATRPQNIATGYMFFDEPLGKPIWHKGNGVWVDATGATV